MTDKMFIVTVPDDARALQRFYAMLANLASCVVDAGPVRCEEVTIDPAKIRSRQT